MTHDTMTATQVSTAVAAAVRDIRAGGHRPARVVLGWRQYGAIVRAWGGHRDPSQIAMVHGLPCTMRGEPDYLRVE